MGQGLRKLYSEADVFMVLFAKNHDYWQKLVDSFQVRRKENTLYTSA